MMPIHLTWDDPEKTIVRVVYDGPYTWEEYDQVIESMVSMVKSVPYNVYVLILLDKNTNPPPGDAMSHFRRTMQIMPHNIAFLFTVGAGNPLTRALFRILVQLGRVKVKSRITQSEAEARAIIHKHRQLVP